MVSWNQSAERLLHEADIDRCLSIFGASTPTGRALEVLQEQGYDENVHAPWTTFFSKSPIGRPVLAWAFDAPDFLAELRVTDEADEMLRSFAYLSGVRIKERAFNHFHRRTGAGERRFVAVAGVLTDFNVRWSRAVAAAAATPADCDLVVAARAAGWSPKELTEHHRLFGAPMTRSDVEVLAAGVPYEYARVLGQVVG